MPVRHVIPSSLLVQYMGESSVGLFEKTISPFVRGASSYPAESLAPIKYASDGVHLNKNAKEFLDGHNTLSHRDDVLLYSLSVV